MARQRKFFGTWLGKFDYANQVPGLYDTVERADTLPTYISDFDGRLIYLVPDQSIYYASNGGWYKVIQFALDIPYDNSASGLLSEDVQDAIDELAAATPVIPVTSVFGRIGDVIAAADDYSASEVVNDSGVAGAHVSDALDALAAATPTVKNSIENDAGSLQLVNDEASPDANSVYGTDHLAVLGYQDTEELFWYSMPGPTRSIVFADSPYTVVAFTYQMYRIDTTGGNIVINLPSALNMSGLELMFNRSVGAVNSIIINASGAELIAGLASASLVTLYDTLTLRSYGTGWDIV